MVASAQLEAMVMERPLQLVASGHDDLLAFRNPPTHNLQSDEEQMKTQLLRRKFEEW